MVTKQKSRLLTGSFCFMSFEIRGTFGEAVVGFYSAGEQRIIICLNGGKGFFRSLTALSIFL